jgi:hypothetical protein
VTVVVVLAIGAGAATWLLVNKPSKSSSLQDRIKPSQSASQTSPRPTTHPSSSPAPTVTVTVTSPGTTVTQPSPITSASVPVSGGSLVTLGAGAAGDSRAAGVEQFATSYFTAINDHSYSEYLAILSPELAAHETLAEFNYGFGSTHDSGVTINSITTVSPGVTGINLSFTSHQRASQSVDQQSTCTDWESVTLYLDNDGSQYLLGPSPNNAVHTDC